MPSFKLNATVHYGYLRAPGVYDDLSDADQRALAKYGGPIIQAAPEIPPPAPQVPAIAEVSSARGDHTPPEGHIFEDGPEGIAVVTDLSRQADEPPEPTRPNDPPERPPAAAPFHCPRDGCKFANGRKSFPTAAARDAHLTQKGH